MHLSSTHLLRKAGGQQGRHGQPRICTVLWVKLQPRGLGWGWKNGGLTQILEYHFKTLMTNHGF